MASGAVILFFLVGVQMWKFGVMACLGLISLPIGWRFLHDYQKERVYTFLDPERDPLQAELYEDPPEIRNGVLHLKQAPGLGLTLSPAALAKYGQRIV